MVQLGGKGANLAEMCRIGLRVPPGMTISTSTCKVFHEVGALLLRRTASCELTPAKRALNVHAHWMVCDDSQCRRISSFRSGFFVMRM